jgi:hypothetical protein
MKTFKQYIQESLKHYKNTRVEEDDVEQPTWRYHTDGSPIVVVPKGYVEASKRALNSHDFNKHWHHPFSGLIPHEHDEAKLSRTLMRHPNIYKDRQVDTKGKKLPVDKLRTLSWDRVKKMHGQSASDLDKDMVKTGTTQSGGYAHEILVNRDNRSKDYYKRSGEHDDAIEAVRKKLTKRHHLKGSLTASQIWKDK